MLNGCSWPGGDIIHSSLCGQWHIAAYWECDGIATGINIFFYSEKIYTNQHVATYYRILQRAPSAPCHRLAGPNLLASLLHCQGRRSPTASASIPLFQARSLDQADITIPSACRLLFIDASGPPDAIAVPGLCR